MLGTNGAQKAAAPLIGGHVKCGWPCGMEETCLCSIRVNKRVMHEPWLDSHMQCKLIASNHPLYKYMQNIG